MMNQFEPSVISVTELYCTLRTTLDAPSIVAPVGAIVIAWALMFLI